MPDKIDKYVIDNELIDKGWEQMQVILERELPVEKEKRRIFPIWWWSSGIAASVLLAGLFIFDKNEAMIVENKAQLQVTQPTIKMADNEAVLSESPSNIIQSQNKNLLIDNKNTTITTHISKDNALIKMDKTKLASVGKEKLSKGVEIPKGAVSQGVINDNVIAGTVVEPLSVKANTSISSHIKTEAQDNAIGKTQSESLRSTLALVPYLSTPAFTELNAKAVEKDFGIKKASVATKLPKKFRHGIFGRINYMGFIDNSFAFGYMNQYKIGKRHHLQTRLYAERNSRFVRTITETYKLPKALFDNKSTSSFPSALGDTTVSQVVYPFYENCACAAIARQNNISSVLEKNDRLYVLANSWHIGLGANYAYRLSPRWELASGFGLSYAMKSLEYNFAIYEKNTLLENQGSSDSNTPVINNIGAGNSGFVSQQNSAYANFAKEQEVFNRLDGYWELGMNFYVNKRFSLGGSYRRGVIDITKNDALGIKDYNRTLTMQSVFFF